MSRDDRFRILFRMLAESRGLVPNWHPPTGTATQWNHCAIAWSAGGGARSMGNAPGDSPAGPQGCHAGTLVVPPFNGGCSTARSPSRNRARSMTGRSSGPARIVDSLRARGQRTRIDYRDLGASSSALFRKHSRLRAGLRRAGTGSRCSSARRRRSKGDGIVLHTANDYRLRRAPDAASDRRRRRQRRDPQPSRRRSGDGKRGVSGIGLPVPRACVRTCPHRGRDVPRHRCR